MSTVSGTLTNKISSTVSRPIVHYAASYSAVRISPADRTVTFTLNFEAWLNSSASTLGDGIGLSVCAHINSEEYRYVIIKPIRNAPWSGTSRHYATLTLTAQCPSDTATIEFYVERIDSLGGSAGTLARKTFGNVSIPLYSPTTYRVSYSVSGDIPTGYSAPVDDTAYPSGATVTVKAVPSIDGYTFAGWSRNGVKVTSFIITGDTTLSGIWSKNSVDSYVSRYTADTFADCIVEYFFNGQWNKCTPEVYADDAWNMI